LIAAAFSALFKPLACSLSFQNTMCLIIISC
jgi:hypothetical protein